MMSPMRCMWAAAIKRNAARQRVRTLCLTAFLLNSQIYKLNPKYFTVLL